jgi:Protein of unknown function (DUF3142)
MISAPEDCVTRSGQLRSLAVFLVVCVISSLISFGVLRRFACMGARNLQKRSKEPDRTGLPPVMLWAWERPDDLELLDSKRAGVAFLAGTVFVRSIASNGDEAPDEGVVLRPRLQPLRLPEGVALMAVVRIETQQGWSQSGYQPAKQAGAISTDGPYREAQRRRVVSLINRLTVLPEVRAVQIDFDAARSEQGFYRALLVDLRKALPPGMPISITALASWCVGDPWMEKLPPGTINEAVPMLFRMGPDGPNIASFLNGGNEFPVAACRESVGISTDEDFSRKTLRAGFPGNSGDLRAKRVYVFHPKAWNAESVQKVVAAVYTWHEESSAAR